jgi:DNA-binding PadR family transcriptional regulator
MQNRTRVRVRYKPSFETDRKIMKVLALEKEFAQYDMPKRISKNYRTVLRHVTDLKKNGLIRLSRTEESKKGGKDRNIYTLTEHGLLYALAFSDVWQDIDKVASNYHDMIPLIFGEWDFYIEKGLRNGIITRLQAAVQGFLMQLGRERYRIVRADQSKTWKTKREKLESREIAEKFMARHRRIAPTLTDKVIGLVPYLYLGQGSEAMSKQWKFISVLIENPKIRKYLDDEFSYWVKNAKLEHDRYVHALRRYNELKASKGSQS